MNEFLFNILAWFQSWSGSWGMAMILFTLMIRLVLTPFDYKSRVSMRKTTLLQPQLTALQKKYANDKEKLNAKTAELYKKEHINPLSSCLPMLLTWPVLIFVFNAMRMAANLEMLGQVEQILNLEPVTMEPFLWIKNLWMPDSLFSSALPDLSTLQQISSDQWVTWFNNLESIPTLMQDLNLTVDSFGSDQLQNTIKAIQGAMASGNAEYASAVAVQDGWTFNLLITSLSVVKEYNGLMLLPILSSVSQIIMTKISSAGQPQQQSNDQNASTAKFMQWFFPIFSLVICFGYSSAFALYWVVGNVASLVQTLVINAILDKKDKALKAGEGK